MIQTSFNEIVRICLIVPCDTGDDAVDGDEDDHDGQTGENARPQDLVQHVDCNRDLRVRN